MICVEYERKPTNIYGLRFDVDYNGSNDVCGCNPEEIYTFDNRRLIDITLSKLKPQHTLEIGCNTHHFSPHHIIKRYDCNHTIITEEDILSRKDSGINIAVDFIYIDLTNYKLLFAAWDLTRLLKKRGIIIVNNTNFWFGSLMLIDAIDSDIFSYKKWFENKNDWGMTMFFKLQETQ